MKKLFGKMWAWLTSEARWFMTADWKWFGAVLIFAALIYGPTLFGVKIGPWGEKLQAGVDANQAAMKEAANAL